MKKYIIYAGVNGAGKSTLYQTNHVQADLARINTDGIYGMECRSTRRQPSAVIPLLYEENLINLGKVLPLCDLAAIYDNTSRFRRFAIFKKGNLIVLSKP